MKKRMIIFIALIGLAIFFKCKRTSDRGNEVSSDKSTVLKKSQPLRVDKSVIQKTPVLQKELVAKTLPSEENSTIRTTPPKDMVPPQADKNVIRFEANTGDSGFIVLTPLCVGCKPVANMILSNAASGVRVQVPQPNSNNIKDYVRGTRRTLGFHGTCGNLFHVVIIFSIEADATGNARFRKFLFRFHAGGIQQEDSEVSSQEFITDLENTKSLEDCELIQPPG